MGRADHLLVKLRAAEDRVKELESDAQHYQARALQAENWMVRIHSELQEGFFGPAVSPDRGGP